MTTLGRDGVDSTPQYYDLNAPITRPVTTIQVESFVPREGMRPSLVLSDGSHYFGPVVEDNGYRIPCGCGIILFQQEAVVRPSLTATAAADRNKNKSNTGGFASFFWGRGSQQDGGASHASETLTALCKLYRPGDRYGGDWANGTFHGEGVLVTSTFTYHGTWREGQMRGRGTVCYTRKYVDYQPSHASSSGTGEGVGGLLLKGLSFVSPFDLTAGAAAPKEYIGDLDAEHYRHGMGMMQYYNGDVYEGEWRDNCRHGRGKLRMIDGEVYDGDWAFDKRHGNGKIMYPNGSVFKGSMESDQRNGEGIMRFANGDEFFGTFHKDRIDGHGTMRYRNGDVYEGSWRDQLRHGQGKYTLKRTGATMHGEFLSGLIHGEGTVIVPGFSTFVGIFIRGERTVGTMHWHQQPKARLPSDTTHSASASAAEGPSKPPEASTVVETQTSDSAASPPPGTSNSSVSAAVAPSAAVNRASTRHYLCYQGKWHGEHMHGRGLLWYTNGDFYAGNFNKSLRHGAGNMRYAAEKAEFSGQFVQGMRHGLGVLQRADKSIQAGRWQQDVFVEGYEGEWDGSTFYGIGRLTMPVDTFLALRSNNPSVKMSQVNSASGDVMNLDTASVSCTASEEGGGCNGGSSRVTATRKDLPPFFMQFVGAFRNGLRDGPGVLQLPALDGLIGSSLSLSGERKLGGGGGGGQRGHNGGGDSSNGNSPTPTPSMIIKGRWVREVLHCEKGVWAFPSGIVYIGGFLNGTRDAARACVWWPDGSVLESEWCGDTPSGAGIWHRRNRSNPVYKTMVSDAQHRVQAQGSSKKAPTNLPLICADTSGDHEASEEASPNGSGIIHGSEGDLLGASVPQWFMKPGLIAGGTSRSCDSDGGTDDMHNDLPHQRTLVDFSNHFTFYCTWSPYTIDVNTYASVVLPQIGRQTAPPPDNTTWPQLHHSPSMAAAFGAPQTSTVEAAKVGRSIQKNSSIAAPATATGSVGKAPPSSALWHVPTAKHLSACAKSLHLAEIPSSVTVGRASGKGVVYFDGGVVLSGEWLDNVPRLAVPYRPWSAFDEFITWQTNRPASRNCISTVPCPTAPRLQSCYTSALESAPEDVTGEPRRFSVRRTTVVLSPLGFRRDDTLAEHAAVSCTAPPPSPSPNLRCTFCSKDYSFFRKRLHCTLCLRSSCSACLGPMETDGLTRQEDVKALLQHAYVTAEQTVQLSAAATTKNSSTNTGNYPSLSAAQVDHAFDKGVSTVPVCADCVRAVLWKLRYTQLWIPITMFASVLEANEDQREALRNSGTKATQSTSNDETHRSDVTAGDPNIGGTGAVDLLGTAVHGNKSPQNVVENSPDADVFLSGNDIPSRCATANPSDAAPAGTATPAFTSLVDSPASKYANRDSFGAMEAEGTATHHPPSNWLAPQSASRNSDVETSDSHAKESSSAATPLLSSRRCHHSESTPRSKSELLPPTQYITYSGYTSHTIPHLYGEMWWGRRYYYRGGFRAGERHGFGTQYMPNGEWYEGGFARNEWHGEGVYHLDDGSVLLGEFLNGKLHVLRYHGEVEEDKVFGVRPHGRGIGYSPDGSIYNGEWVHGLRHGTGMLHLADGISVYSGTFVSDAMEGMGKLVTTSGAYYGDFSRNKQNGKGLLFTADCVVEGSWINGTSSGFTRIYERDTGEVYETTYCDGNERDDCFTTPVVTEDSDASECGQCGTAFSFFLRRHHCRLCGDVFCDACTQHRATLPPSVTRNVGFHANSEVATPSASAVSEQQLRVCDACFLRLSQRRMLALRRYADGSVYAGCWSQGRWVSRGLYCRSDGLFVVMNTLGHALLPTACITKAKMQLKDDESEDIQKPKKRSAELPVGGLGIGHRPSRAAGVPPSPSILQDAAPAKELLDSVSESSPRKDLDAFLLWWATTRSRCGLHVPLDIALVSHYQLMPAQMLRGREATVKANSDTAMYLATPRRCTAEMPRTPSLAPVRLFVTLAESWRAMQAMVEGELPQACASGRSEATAASDAVESRLSMEERRTVDGDVEAAAVRASRFMPVVIPRAPVVPITAATVPVTHAAEKTTTAAHIFAGGFRHAYQRQDTDSEHVLGTSSWVPRPPPLIALEDLSDEALIEMIQAERLLWQATGTAPKSDIPPLMPPTPAPPATGLNTGVSWDVWTTRDVPRYAPPPLTPVEAAASSTPKSSVNKSAGEDGAAEKPPPIPRSEADMYFACPHWCPTVPDAQGLLEEGKATQASKLMRRLQQEADQTSNNGPQSEKDGKDNEANESRCATSCSGAKAERDDKVNDLVHVLQSTQGSDPNADIYWEVGHLFSPEQRARCGGGWVPEPMHGPFVFDTSEREMCRSADGQSFYPKVMQREVENM